MSKIGIGPGHPVGGNGKIGLGEAEEASEAIPRPGLVARLRAVSDLTPRRVLRQPFRLPLVTGDELSIEKEGLWNEFETVGAGQFAQPAAGKHASMLTHFSLDAMTMFWTPHFMTVPHIDPGDVLSTLEEILDKRAVFDLLLTRRPQASFPEYSGLARITQLTRTLRHGEADTYYLAITFSSFRRMSSRRRRHGKAAKLPTTAVLTADDTLRSLAEHYYGSGSEWRLIAQANGIEHWGSEDPLVKMQRYKVGSRIKIPARPHKSAPKVGESEVAQAIEVGG